MKNEINKDKASLLNQWKSKAKSEAFILKITKAPEWESIPLSHGQRRLWFLQQLYPKGFFYNYSEAYVFKGEIDDNKLIEAIELVCNDHAILRSTYHMNEGVLSINTFQKANIGFTIHDLSDQLKADAEIAANEIMLSESKTAFDLSKQPMVLASLIKIHDTKHIMLLTMHHISTDKWSMGILRSEWARYYNDLCNGNLITHPKNTIQYSDYSYWQQKQKIAGSQLKYWRNKLSGEIPFINLPTDFVKPVQPSFEGGASPTQYFSKILSEQVLTLAKKLEVTPYVLLLSVYYVLLFRYSGQKDILIGSPVASRDHKVLENLIGFFNDTVVLRTALKPEMKFEDLVLKVKETTLEAFSNKDIPFDTLVSELKQERSLSVNPFFQVMFLYHAVPTTPSFGAKVSFKHNFFDAGVSKFDLTLYISEEEGILSSTIEYTSDLFKSESINRFQKHFKNLLEGIVSQEKKTISDISILTDQEKQFFQSQNSKVENPFEKYQGIHEIIEKMSVQHPDKTAISHKNDTMTYAELNRKATVLAAKILSETNNGNEIVALCIERSLDMIVGLLGILKAGCAYLPIDPAFPVQRIDFMLHDSDVNVIVSQSKLAALFDTQDAKIVSMETIKTEEIIEKNLLPQVHENDLAYMIYTSGSTGQPKGVPITHKNIMNSTGGRLQYYDQNPASFLLMSSISFDSSKAGIFWTLCTGGNLVIAENRLEQDISRLTEVIAENKISHTLMLPSLYQLLLDYSDIYKLGSLKTVIVAGETCSSHLSAEHFKKLEKVELHNEYGPTEATVWCIAHKLERAQTKRVVPIGKPVANATIYILDEVLNKVPLGVIGEIYIGGVGLAGKYYKRPDLTAKTYIKNPFESSKDEILYKTGDLGRYRNDGNIEFFGRSDQQVKIRGYRIEIDEIENAILEVSDVEKCVVLVEIFGKNKANRLTAYLTSAKTLGTKVLRTKLNERLPDYMVPTMLIQVPEIPTLPNGKIDKTLLQKFRSQETSLFSSDIEIPRSDLEIKLLSLWREVLQIDTISIQDNFFDLGGDSLLSIQFIAKAKKSGLRLSPNQLFDYQTITKLAAFLASKNNDTEDWDYLVALRKEGSKKPLFCIHAGGGHIFFYNILTKHIAKYRPIYALQASGVYANQNMHSTIEQMATDYLNAMRSVQAQGPYNIVVYCFSVAVGHQIAHQLSKQNQVANLIIMDTMAEPWNLNTPKRLKMRVKGFIKRTIKNPIKAVSNMISDRWVFAKSKLVKVEATKEAKALVDLNLNLAKISKVYEWHPVKAEVSIILTEKEEESINEEIVNSWKELILGDVRLTRTKGIHRNLFEEPNVKGVALKIDEFAV